MLLVLRSVNSLPAHRGSTSPETWNTEGPGNPGLLRYEPSCTLQQPEVKDHRHKGGIADCRTQGSLPCALKVQREAATPFSTVENGHARPSTIAAQRNAGPSTPATRVNGHMAAKPGVTLVRPLSTRGSSGNLGAQAQSSHSSDRPVHHIGLAELPPVFCREENSANLLCRWRFAVLLWVAAALWWFGMRAIETKWDIGRAASPFCTPLCLIPATGLCYNARTTCTHAALTVSHALQRPRSRSNRRE